MPKVVQEEDKKQLDANTGSAITYSEPLDSLFTAGSITQKVWLHGLAGWAHVGRIKLSSRTWHWHKQLAKSDMEDLNIVTAIAVDPAGTKVACYGYSSADLLADSTDGYIFVLDASTGMLVSGLMKMSHQQVFMARGPGFMLKNDGTVLMTTSAMDAGTVDDLHLIGYDSVSNSIGFSLRVTG